MVVGQMLPQPRLPWLEATPHFSVRVAGGVAEGVTDGVASVTAEGTEVGTSGGEQGETKGGDKEGEGSRHDAVTVESGATE